MDAGMIALLPEDPAALTVDSKSALPASQIHLTLVYLGDDVTAWQEDRVELLIRDVAMAVQDLGGAIPARVMGHATFNPDGGPDGTTESCAVHLIGHSGLLAPMRDLVDEVCQARLVDDYPEQHQPFLPHCTAGYGLTAGDLTYTGPVVFNRIVVAIAGRWAEIALQLPADESIAPYARTAYAQGWARTGGPMTDRVRAGCTAAVDLAVTHADQPGILEATMRLGSLEGTWAAVYARREALVAHHTKLVMAAWRRSAHMLNVSAAIDRFRQSMGLGESVDTDNTTHRRLVANSVASTVASTIAGPDAAPSDREAIIEATSAALMDAEAEGYASAVMVGADQLGVSGTDFELVFHDAHAALGDLGNYWGQGSGWVDRMVAGNATDLGGRLSTLAADGADYQEMLDAARDVIGGDDVRAVATILDLAMGQSFTRGALALYAREGVPQVDFVTAGGTRVCPVCMAAEGKNPWERNAVPQPPLHPYCRCNVQASDPMQGLAAKLTQYLTAV